MKKIKVIIRILVILLICIISNYLLKYVNVNKWIYIIISGILCISIFILIVIYSNFRIKNNKSKKDFKELFNTYYINYPKVYEIAMLINNKIKTNSEESIVNKKENKHNYGFENLFNLKKLPINGKLEVELSNLTNHEYKEIQEVKNTNSIYLREILKKCKKIGCLSNLKNGDLIKIDNVKIDILNNDEILQTKSIISGAFNDNTINAHSSGQTLKININSLTNMILKDYKYYLICTTKCNEKFYIDIPMKADKEFENEYSIYDLEIGFVNIIGIYRTKFYSPQNKNTYSKLQELGNKQRKEIDDMKSSREKKNNKKDMKNLKKAPYIDLIAIIQDLSFKNGENFSNEK